MKPACRRVDETWFRNEWQNLKDAEGEDAYSGVAPGSRDGCPQQWGIALGWAPWGAADWKFYRAWAVARISRAIPLTVWGAGGVVRSFPACPCCAAPEANLEHILESCPGTEAARREALTGTQKHSGMPRLLYGSEDMEVLRGGVRATGQSIAAVVAGLVSRGQKTIGE